MSRLKHRIKTRYNQWIESFRFLNKEDIQWFNQSKFIKDLTQFPQSCFQMVFNCVGGSCYTFICSGIAILLMFEAFSRGISILTPLLVTLSITLEIACILVFKNTVKLLKIYFHYLSLGDQGKYPDPALIRSAIPQTYNAATAIKKAEDKSGTVQRAEASPIHTSPKAKSLIECTGDWGKSISFKIFRKVSIKYYNLTGDLTLPP